MRKFKDTNTGAIITEAQLRSEFRNLQRDYPDEYDYSFAEYISNTLSKNGILEEVLYKPAKWRSVEIPYLTRKDIDRASNFKYWLDCNDFCFEVSANGDFIHIEILLTDDQIQAVNDALDSIVWPDAIT